MPGADANAFPRKNFFYEMFTRDISLEDCILDLIDNSIDSLTRRKKLDLGRSIFKRQPRERDTSLPYVSVTFSENEIAIVDNCGGIDREDAISEVFCFGHTNGTKGQLGAYGIGLKRAIFKLGDHVEIRSQTTSGGFSASISVKEWAERDADLEDWKIPLTFIAPARSAKEAGTSIRFTKLRKEVAMRLRDGAIQGRLRFAIGQTYALFLNSLVQVRLGNQLVQPQSIPLGSSDEVKPAHSGFTDNGVKVTLLASLADRKAGEWRQDLAGWYVLCNGRVVVTADKSDLTGWGAGMPAFHSKYIGFVGLALFQSGNPLSLPWTTTKRGLNRESPVYQLARREMCAVARPIISFLNKMYPSDLEEQNPQRKIARGVEQADIRTMVSKPQSLFTAEAREKTQVVTSIRIQYDAEKTDIDRIRKHIRRPTWSARRIGLHTFQYFLKTECPE